MTLLESATVKTMQTSLDIQSSSSRAKGDDSTNFFRQFRDANSLFVMRQRKDGFKAKPKMCSVCMVRPSVWKFSGNAIRWLTCNICLTEEERELIKSLYTKRTTIQENETDGNPI